MGQIVKALELTIPLFGEGSQMVLLLGLAWVLNLRLARMIIAIDYRRLPEEVIQKAKQCLLDTIGAAIAGSRTPEGVTLEGSR